MPTACVIRRSCGWWRYRADRRRKKPTPSCARITASWPVSRGHCWMDCPPSNTMPNSTACWVHPFMASTRPRLRDPNDRLERKCLMAISPLAGKPAPKDLLIDLANLERAYYDRRPDVNDRYQLVAFGTSGHRGTPLKSTFTESHILAITQAICDYRRGQGTDGPPRAVRAWSAHRPGSIGGQRRRDDHPARRRGDPDSGHLARHPRLQPRPQGPLRRRHCHHAIAQSAGGRRLQVQHDQWRAGR